MNRKKPEPKFKNVLSRDQKEALFQSAVCDAEVYALVSQSEIEPDHFQDLDMYLWYIWDITDTFYRRRHRLPTRKELSFDLDQRIDDPNDPLEDQIVEDLQEFYAGLKKTAPLEKDTAREYLQQFLLEKAWRGVYRLTSERRKLPVSLEEVLDQVKKDTATASAVAAESIPSPFDIPQYDPFTSHGNLTPYGVPFIDAYLGGGGMAGEVYLVLGATGSGKTSIVQQLSISLAALQMSQWERGNKRQSLGVSYFISYEMAGAEIMARFYANFAQINIQKIFEGVPLTRNGEMSTQDQALFAKAIEYGIRVPSEHERFEYARRRLRHNWRLVDFSGMSLREEDKPNPSAGSGLCPEIAQRIEADMEAARSKGLKRHVAGIFIDYVGIMAHRHCQFHDKDPSRHLRIICNETPQSTRTYLSYRFKCPVFLAHQLNAAAVKLKPGQIADMTEAQESKTMADNCNVVFVLARPTEDQYRLTRIGRQKGRRMPGMGPTVLQVQGQYARLREVGSLWSWDDLTRQFIPQSEMDVRHYAAEKEEETKKPVRFDGQEFEVFKLSE